ncbi:hypothetical protein [Methylobrevis albus]|uniref:Uncharacterized protein n=1 Tax=Methylobrevis albus TaxID=2793297 RepID=A0A931I099_9HYPH|nr:hypothetical protein [Methylobrevis albus]MBH0236608.1 hypothetical protein [Methylobrevis albus]
MNRKGEAVATAGAGHGDEQERAWLVEAARLLRLLLAAAEHAPDGVLTLAKDSPILSLARRAVGATADDIESTRTAMMALRDLVWRVDSARGLLEQRLDAAERAELGQLLATDDIHRFLDRERRPAFAAS